MKTQFTDKHFQVESGNQVFDRGMPRQVVRRHFPGKGVIWFEKRPVAGENLERLGIDTAEHLEQKFVAGTDKNPVKVIHPKEF